MHLFVHNQEGRIAVDLEADSTVADLLRSASAQFGRPGTLVYGGEDLIREDVTEKTPLSDIGISSETALQFPFGELIQVELVGHRQMQDDEPGHLGSARIEIVAESLEAFVRRLKQKAQHIFRARFPGQDFPLEHICLNHINGYEQGIQDLGRFLPVVSDVALWRRAMGPKPGTLRSQEIAVNWMCM